MSDVVVVTSDNPRSEDPGTDHRGDQARHRSADRVAARTAGRSRRRRWPSSIAGGHRARDRPRAAGRSGADRRKGPREDQVIGDRELPFDDVVVARAALARAGTRLEGDVSGVRTRIVLTAGVVAAAAGGQLAARRPAQVSAGSRSTRGRIAARLVVHRASRRAVRRHGFVGDELGRGAARRVVDARPDGARRQPRRRR